MSYIITYFQFHLIATVALIAIYDTIVHFWRKDEDYMSGMIIMSLILSVVQTGILKSILSIITLFLIAPYAIIINIKNLFIKEEYKNVFEKEYYEYFYYKFNLENKTLEKIKNILKENKIQYKSKYLNEITAYAIKVMHEMHISGKKDKFNIADENDRMIFLILFAKKLEITVNISKDIFDCIENELKNWIMINALNEDINELKIEDGNIIIEILKTDKNKRNITKVEILDIDKF